MRNVVTLFGILGALTLYAVAQNPSCGSLNDTAIHTPPNYTCSAAAGCQQPGSASNAPLAPPSAANATIVDPEFGCTIKRLTTFGEEQSGQASHNYYSTTTSVSANDTFVQVFQDNGSKYIIRSSNASVAVSLSNFPNSRPGASGALNNITPWDRVTDNVFYYATNNTFVKATINNPSACGTSCTVTSTTLATFSGFSACSVPDEENISQGNQYIWLVCTPTGGGTNVAVAYDFKNNIVLSSSLAVGVQDGSSSPGWHKMQVLPSGKLYLTPGGGGPVSGCTQSTECIYNTNGTLYWNPGFAYTSHTGIGQDLSGNDVIIHPGSGGGPAQACGTQQWSSLTVYNVSTKTAENCLIGGTGTGCVGTASCAGPILDNWEISYEDSPNGWVLITMCEDGCGGPGMPGIGGFDNCSTTGATTCVSGGSTDLMSNWASIWLPYDQEVILARIDGSAIYRMAHHRSRDGENYWAVPRGTISTDAAYIVFDSNWDISNSGDTSAQYADMYLIPTGIGSTQPGPPSNLQATVSP